MLLSRLSGGQQVDIALRVLEVIKLGATDGMDGFLKVGENVESVRFLFLTVGIIHF